MKKLLILFSILSVFCFLPGACGAGFIAFEVFNGDYSKFSKDKILEILSKETILYYADGTSQLGSLFGQVHRIYVPIDRIPAVMKNAIISAEDEDFYSNIGIDPKGILRAAIHNILFRTRQGASTITQQTVKNLYGRKETDLATKFYEMINAFKLERMYSKDQILEFYLNQFHVTGNGRGVGVAAKYYFNKEVEDLNLVESAFIAGSVKGPEKYNPFTKTTAAGQEKARRDALVRKNYVLDRMFKAGKINKKDYDDALKLAVPFSQGRFQYNELSVNQVVIKQLTKTEILQALGTNSVDEIGTMGLRITTTLDKDIQNATQYGLRQNLSGMQMILKGFQKEPSTSFSNISKPELHNFYAAQVSNIVGTPGSESVMLSFGVNKCLADTESINRIAIKTDQTMHRGLDKSKSAFLHSLSVGDTVLASVKKIPTQGDMLCDLESRPKIQGASLVLDKGKIIAMAGGFSSNEYNRALFALRQPGSTFKLPTFYAALQMGWSVVDSLPNVRDVFPWQGTFYFPRPDHLPKSMETTILGAGAQSENLASIWLLSHMLDKLNENQFQDLLKFVGIMKDGASKTDALAVMANKFNATPDNIPNLTEGVLNKLKINYATDLTILNDNTLKLFVRTLHYGTGFEAAEQPILDDTELTEKEQKIRINTLKNNLLRWNELESKIQNAVRVAQNVSLGNEPITETNRELLSHFAFVNDRTDALAYISKDAWKPDLATPHIAALKIRPLGLDEIISLARSGSSLLSRDAILLDGVLPPSLLQSFNDNLSQMLKQVDQLGPLEKMYWNADFRYSLAMYYTAHMANAMGVSEPLQWVPSFPLGSNVVTLADLSLMYQTFLNGKMYRYFNTNQVNQLLVIKRIEDSNGNLLWESKGTEIPFADAFFSTPLLNTMRGTVTGGTAYLKLNGNMILRSNDDTIDAQLVKAKIRVPSFGKTGTTNNFTNGTYIGFLPYPSYKGDSLSPNNAYTIASYVGYDSNEPMVRNWFHAVGGDAIPAWQEIALNIVKTQKFADKLNWQDLVAQKSHLIPFNYGSGLSQVVVPINSGVSISAQTPESDDEDESKDIYANDYSDTGRKTFAVFLEGSVSDNIFVPKRKTSFYTPLVLPPQGKK
jgi:penicillin-binding protein 1A